jgi:hypothetical protein
MFTCCAAILAQPARAGCVEPSNSAAFEPARAAIASWEDSRGIHLGPEERSTLLEQYCAAIKTVMNGMGVEVIDLTVGAEEPIWAYLDASASSQAKIQSIDNLVQAQFSLHGSAQLPEPKAMGVVRIVYRRTADALRVNGKTMGPYPRLFAKLGPISIAGLASGNVICSATLKVSAIQAVEFIC